MLADHYVCDCGVKNIFSSWLYAHWYEPVTHLCECGRKNHLLEGRVTRVEEAATKEKKRARPPARKPTVPAKESSVKEKVRPKKGKG